MRIFALLLSGALAMLALPGRAQDCTQQACSDAVMRSVGRQLGIADFTKPRDGTHGVIAAAACKGWPGDPGRMLGVFAYEGGREYTKELVVAVLAARSHEVLASYRGEIAEDAVMAVGEGSLQLDTAPFVLGPGRRAFGVRVHSLQPQGCAWEGGLDDDLTLYVVEGRRIRPVFNQTTAYWTFGSGNRCGGEGAPRIDGKVLVAVEPTTTNGWSDLRLIWKRSDRRTASGAVVKYNGKAYDITPFAAMAGDFENPDWKRVKP
jgi:hypothetical protein